MQDHMLASIVEKICTGASKVGLKPSPVKKLEPRMPIRQILSADDLSVDLSAALINDSQLTESLSMVINTDQLRVSSVIGGTRKSKLFYRIKIMTTTKVLINGWS